MIKNKTYGHILAIITITIWGTTFISTKILLNSFSPIEILIIRFIMGFAALCIIYPKPMKFQGIKREVCFAASGLCGICLYYLLENIALTYTCASNVGIIVSVAPFFTAIISKMFFKKTVKLHLNFFIGFAAAIAGIVFISLDKSTIEANPIGDLLAMLAAIIWALYSLLSQKISSYGLNTIQTTRRTFLYGIMFMLLIIPVFHYNPDYSLLIDKNNIFNLLYLGLGASALCFASWNLAVKSIGAVKTSVYIYMVPVITVVSSAIILEEKVTVSLIAGTILTLTGLIISETKMKGKNKNELSK